MFWLYFGILIVCFVIIIFCLKTYLKSRIKNGRKGKRKSIQRFYSLIQKEKLLDPPIYVTLLIPIAIFFIFLAICLSEGVFRLNFKEDIFPFIYALPKAFLTPTVLIAILGPTILALNYRLFKGHVSDLDTKENKYAGLYKSGFRPNLDAQFDHTHQLNALIIAWGAFAFEIINGPIERLTKLADTIQASANHHGIVCQNSCLSAIENKYGDALNYFIDIVGDNFISVIIVAVAVGFVVWSFVRLISGELSTPEMVSLYEKRNRPYLTSPPFASRITLYRYIFVSFTFLYLSWTNCYLSSRARDYFFNKCKFDEPSSQLINKDIMSRLTLPKDDRAVYLVVLIIIFLVLIYIKLYYRAEFIYKLKSIWKLKRKKATIV